MPKIKLVLADDHAVVRDPDGGVHRLPTESCRCLP